jgi:hypothetical protein
MADPEVEEPEGQAPARNWRKELEGRIKELEGQNSELSRKLAFTEAGLSGLSEKKVKALLAAHEGDISAEAIKATATELGFGAKTAEAEGESEGAEGTAEVDGELAHLSNFAGAPAPEGREVLTQEKVDEMIKAVPPEQLDDWMYANRHLFGIS